MAAVGVATPATRGCTPRHVERCHGARSSSCILRPCGGGPDCLQPKPARSGYALTKRVSPLSKGIGAAVFLLPPGLGGRFRRVCSLLKGLPPAMWRFHHGSEREGVFSEAAHFNN